MDAKILVGGVVGVGLVCVAGILIFDVGLGGAENEAGMTRTSGEFARGDRGDHRLGSTSAYELPAAEETQGAELKAEARDLQPARRNGEGGRGGGDRMARVEERLARFDADGDGILNAEERDAMMEAMRARMTGRFDADGDGVVSIEEQFAARRKFLMDSRRGDRLRDQFDADGDGELNAQEQAAMEAELDQRDAKRMEGILREHDTNGDGEMSVEETLAMQEQQLAQRRARIDRLSAQFDQDGDGNLNADERANAMNSMIEQRELANFLRRYDSNGDGKVGTSDFERFTDSYGHKEPHADVNRDGVVNVDDLAMFRDMAERTLALDN